MALRKEQNYSDEARYPDFDPGDEVSLHKKRVRRMLEDRLEQKRLKKELEDFEGELEDDFDWDEIKR